MTGDRFLGYNTMYKYGLLILKRIRGQKRSSGGERAYRSIFRVSKINSLYFFVFNYISRYVLIIFEYFRFLSICVCILDDSEM